MKKIMGIALFCLIILLGNSSTAFAAIELEDAEPMDYRILVISIDPEVNYNGKIKASEYLGFSLDSSISSLKNHIERGSNHTVNIEIVDKVWMNEFPKYKKYDSMTEEQFFKLFPANETNRWFGWWERNDKQNILPKELDGVEQFDYDYLFEKCNLIERKNNDEFDAVWVFSIDPSGMWEANIVGRGYMRSNGKFLREDCDDFLLLGLTFSRQDGAIESFCHAVEGIMNETYNVSDSRYNSIIEFDDIAELNMWERFFFNKYRASSKNTVYGVGQVHFSPNSTHDYDWQNTTTVKSYYTDFMYNYPNVGDTITDFNPYDAYLPYEISDAESHHEWWLSLMPHYKGRGADGYLHNWWEYILRTDYVTQISYENSEDAKVVLNIGEKISVPNVIVHYISGKEEKLALSDMVYKAEGNDIFGVEGDRIIGNNLGSGKISVVHDGEILEYTVEVNCNHSWDSGKVIKEATHITEGTKEYTCINCGENKEESMSRLTEHTYGDWQKDNGAQHKKECECGEVQYEEHTWNDGEVKKDATHLEEGIKYYICKVCEEAKEERISKLTEHTYGDWLKDNSAQHKKECECGEVQYEEHTWNDGEVTLEATHTTVGICTYTCTECGESKEDEISILTDHNYSIYVEKDNIFHEVQCICGATKEEEHDWNTGECISEATHLVEGIMQYTCLRCKVLRTESIAKIDEHHYTLVEQKDSDMHICKCECGDFTEEKHIYDKEEVIKESSVSEEGMKVFICSKCDYSREQKMDKLSDEVSYNEKNLDDEKIQNTNSEKAFNGLAVIAVVVAVLLIGGCVVGAVVVKKGRK